LTDNNDQYIGNVSWLTLPRTGQVHCHDEETWGQHHRCECLSTSRECCSPLPSTQYANQVDPVQQWSRNQEQRLETYTKPLTITAGYINWHISFNNNQKFCYVTLDDLLACFFCTYTLVLTASLQAKLGKPVAECWTTLKFCCSKRRREVAVSTTAQNSKTCKAPVKSPPAMYQHSAFFYKPDDLPVAKPKCHVTEVICFLPR